MVHRVSCSVTSICEIADIAHDSKETDGLERRSIPSNGANSSQLDELLGAHIIFEVRSQTDTRQRGMGRHRAEEVRDRVDEGTGRNNRGFLI